MRAIVTLLLLTFALPCAAQSSASYKAEEHILNAGGRPLDGTVATSLSFQIRFDSTGEPLAGRSSSSASYTMVAGFPSAYPPPGEVVGLRFTGRQTLTWDPERSAGTYDLYRDLNSNLTGLGFGNCEQQGLPGNTATDGDSVPAGDGYFYLVTVENRLDEEGTRGFRSDGTEREGAPCP